MVVGYHHFRKHPYIGSMLYNFQAVFSDIKNFQKASETPFLLSRTFRVTAFIFKSIVLPPRLYSHHFTCPTFPFFWIHSVSSTLHLEVYSLLYVSVCTLVYVDFYVRLVHFLLYIVHLNPLHSFSIDLIDLIDFLFTSPYSLFHLIRFFSPFAHLIHCFISFLLHVYCILYKHASELLGLGFSGCVSEWR